MIRTARYLFGLTALAASAVLMFAGPAIANEKDLVWMPGDGDTLNFSVYRKGNPFGSHIVSFEKSGDELRVKNDIELEVSFGPFRAFYYAHESSETWQGGELIAMTGKTRKDGEDLTLDVSKSGDALTVEGTNYSGTAPLGIIPSSHWNIEEVRSDQILSSEGGQLLDVTVESLGAEEIEAGGKAVTADKYRLVSDLTVELWYDETGRWVKCAFEARGQSIEYVLN